jgi:hypothetical protein
MRRTKNAPQLCVQCGRITEFYIEGYCLLILEESGSMFVRKLFVGLLAIGLLSGNFAKAETSDDDKIAWFGTWEGGLAEAKRTGRPIMLVSAAPHCHQVPGVW